MHARRIRSIITGGKNARVWLSRRLFLRCPVASRDTRAERNGFVRNACTMERRNTRAVMAGTVTIGGAAPISVQSMTKTHTEDVAATIAQVHELAELGCEIARCAVANVRAARVLSQIKRGSPIPLIADIHFDHKLALRAIDAGVDGVRVNPGTIHSESGLREVFRSAAAAGIKVRVGMNSGSVRPREGLRVKRDASEADLAALMVDKALACCELAEAEGCRNLVLSFKASDVPTTVRAYRLAAPRCDYPFHVGVTAAGPAEIALLKNAIGIGVLLAEGIGDTIRVSMTGPPHDEVSAALRILEALELRSPAGPVIISCPTCGRCMVDLVSVVEEVQQRLKGCDKKIKVAIMGCVVNGPGEAAEADVGVAGGKEFGYIFRKGVRCGKVPASQIADALMAEIEKLD